MLAAATGPVESIVAALAEQEAPLAGQVTAEAGQQQGQGSHGGPAGAAVSLGARAWLVETVVLVVGGAVVEEPLHAAYARAVVQHALRGAQALLVADPARGQGPRARALPALTLPTVLAAVRVRAQLWPT